MTLIGTSVPRFARGVRLREDKARGRWVILAPERLFEPDETAIAVLRLINGTRTLDGVIDALVLQFGAPREVILADVTVMLTDLMDRGVITA